MKYCNGSLKNSGWVMDYFDLFSGRLKRRKHSEKNLLFYWSNWWKTRLSVTKPLTNPAYLWCQNTVETTCSQAGLIFFLLHITVDLFLACSWIPASRPLITAIWNPICTSLSSVVIKSHQWWYAFLILQILLAKLWLWRVKRGFTG